MHRYIMATACAVLLFVSIVPCGFVLAGPVEDSFRKLFPQFQFDFIRESEIKGVYEVIKGSDIGFFAPEPGYFIIGDLEVISKDGVNVMEQKRDDLVLSKAKTFPLEKSVKIGNGKNVVIEITDPDCPYCRRAAAFFDKRSDVTKYVFFLPLPYHKDAENKIRYIFCAQDKGKAYKEAMEGKLDDQKYEVCKKQDVENLLGAHKTLTEKVGVRSTPFFIINNRTIVVGYDAKRFQEALEQ